VAPADVEGLLKEGNERSAIIERQEAEILELTRRLEEAERRNLELVDIAEGHKKEYERLKRELEVVRQKNEELSARGCSVGRGTPTGGSDAVSRTEARVEDQLLQTRGRPSRS